jgi:hypothetical protein
MTWLTSPCVPKTGGNYLVSRCNSQGKRAVQQAFWLSGVGWAVPDVVAWQPLPEPYEPPQAAT